MAHEVLPTYGDRHAITLCYYDKIERMKAIKSARDAGSSTETDDLACKRRLDSLSQLSSHGQQGPSGQGLENENRSSSNA